MSVTQLTMMSLFELNWFFLVSTQLDFFFFFFFKII